MKRLCALPAIAICLALMTAAQAQAPSSRKIPFNNITTTMTCTPDPSPCQRNVILRMFDAATAGTQVGGDEPQTVSVDDPVGTGGSINFVLGSTRPAGVDPINFQSGSSRFLDVLDAATLTSVLPGRIELTAVAFAVNPGPQGPAGAQGPQGNPGPQGPPGVVQAVAPGDGSITVAGTAATPSVAVSPNGITNNHIANGALSPAKIAGNAATLGSNNNFTGNGSFAAGLGVGDVASFNIAAAPAGATESGTLVTITTTAPHSFNSGDLVTISGVAVSGYNGTFYLAGPGSATTFTYVAPTAGLAASGGGTAVSGALLSVTKANSSPSTLFATPLLSITNSADAEASISFDGASGNPSTAWRIGVNRPPDNPSFFNGLFFFKYPSTRMAITPGGRVGIGTTIPSKLLDVAGDGNFAGSLSAGSFTGSGAGLTGLNASNLTSGAVADSRLSSNVPLLSNASNTFAGNLSIGANLAATTDIFVGNVTNPAFTGGHSIYFQNNSGDSHNSFRINAGSFGTWDNLFLVANSGPGAARGAGIKFFTAPVGAGQGERMTIDPAGNVGIGTVSPSVKLDVAGDIKTSGKYTGDGSGLTNLSASQFVGGGINPQQVALLKWYAANQTTTFPAGGLPIAPAFDGANIWVANAGAGTVTKLRTNDGTVLGTFTVGDFTYGVAFDGANIWVTHGNSSVTKLRGSDGALLGTFTVGTAPTGVAFDGANIWVANYGLNGTGNTVSKLRASDGMLLGTFTVGTAPYAVAFDGANIWVTNRTISGTVSKLRASDGASLGTFAAGIFPQAAAFDGANIWVANAVSSPGTVTRLRASDGGSLGTVDVGSDPRGVAFDGTNIWVANADSNTVSKLRASDGALLGTFAVGTQPLGVAFDGANIWVTNYASGTVSKL